MAAPEPNAALEGERLRVIPFRSFWRRRPFLGVFLVLLLSNAAGSYFNIRYNQELIVARYLSPRQKEVFEQIALPIYNLVAYPACVGLIFYVLAPLQRCLKMQRNGETVPPAFLEKCRQRVVNLPILQVSINLLGWLPGAVFFPLVICLVGGNEEAAKIWQHFVTSFVVSALFTTVQTFYLLEAYLVEILYPAFFQDARPAEVSGATQIPFGPRVFMMWVAVGVMPMIALWTVAVQGPLEALAGGVLLAGVGSGWLIFFVLRRDLGRWIKLHASATEAVAEDNFDVRIREQRPDEFGKLTDHFNDMAAALGRGKQLRETFGQFVSPEVRDEIMERFPGLEVTLQDITVLFADIRGFTARCSRLTPERAGALLNRFLTLTVVAIEGSKDGLVNKFLGDGVMALFGAARIQRDHADRAIASAQVLLVRLGELNAELEREGDEPLKIGIGIHSGPALVGCFGTPKRREFSAIGETVNLGQRVEQLTKQLGGPILFSAATKERLQQPTECTDLGEHAVPGAPMPLRVYQVLVN